jgi:hypothetical protein
MIWTPYESTCLDEIGWDADLLLLGILFDFGGTYQYFAVPEAVYLAFIIAPSKGTYFNSTIRNEGYSYEKI